MRDVSRFGKYALVHFKGGALGESPVEDYSQGEPRRIRLGYREVPRGIDDALFEMMIGEQSTVIIPPERAYGDYDSHGVLVRMRSEIPDGESLEVGSVLGWKNPISQTLLPAVVVEASKDFVKLDYNHPLAGKSLEYWLELVDIVDE